MVLRSFHCADARRLPLRRCIVDRGTNVDTVVNDTTFTLVDGTML